MNTATIQPKDVSSATSLLVENVRIYLQIKSAFEQCNAEVQDAVKDMIEIVNDESAEADERQRAMYTIVEALFPSMSLDFMSACDRLRRSKDAQENWVDMAKQEATFAENLSAAMKAKDITQEQLATKIGVGQPAIANMLNRNCRPQKKTVIRLADALGVAPTNLWPEFKTI